MAVVPGGWDVLSTGTRCAVLAALDMTSDLNEGERAAGDGSSRVGGQTLVGGWHGWLLTGRSLRCRLYGNGVGYQD